MVSLLPLIHTRSSHPIQHSLGHTAIKHESRPDDRCEKYSRMQRANSPPPRFNLDLSISAMTNPEPTVPPDTPPRIQWNVSELIILAFPCESEEDAGDVPERARC